MAFERGRDRRARHPRAPIGEEQAAGVGHPDETALDHLEHAELVGRAEPVLDGAEQPEGVVPVAFEAQHRVDDVLEHPRPGEATIFGDVPDEHHGYATTLGLGHQAMRAPAYLHDAARRRAEVGVGHGLDAVDDHQLRLHRVERRDHVRQRRLGQ